MARIISMTPWKSNLSLTEPDNPADIQNVFDVSKDCPKRIDMNRRVILLYMKAEGVQIVRIYIPFKNKKFPGTFISFPVARLENSMDLDPIGNTFGMWATNLGLTKPELCALIKTHTPID